MRYVARRCDARPEMDDARAMGTNEERNDELVTEEGVRGDEGCCG